MTMTRRVFMSVSLALFVFTVASVAHGQTPPAELHPNLARGANPYGANERYEWDNVNLFNGNLSSTIPIGISYPVTTNFSYRFSISYNSNIWNFTQLSTAVSASPNKQSNAGLGWDLSFGRLIPPQASGTQTSPWIYISPDGAGHPFYSTIHPGIGENDPGGIALYTRDNTYYRLKVINSTTCTVESPDGTARTFQLIGNDWKLTRISDRFNNWLTFNYATPNVWSITDTHGRVHTVYFKSDTTGYFVSLVDRIELATFGGTRATYTFRYTTETVARPSADTDPATSAALALPVLLSVLLPDGTKYNLTYHNTSVKDASGRLASLQLPTLGKINWTYTPYIFAGSGLPTTLAPVYRSGMGVGARFLTDAPGGTEYGRWTYTPSLKPTGQQNAEMSNTIKTPLGDKVVHYFNVATQTSAGGHRAGYALPGTRNQFDSSWTRILASQVFDCDSTGGNCQLLRSKYVRYEQDSEPSPEIADVAVSSNRREASQRTVYHDDLESGVERFAELERSNFDGLGHYRREVTNGNFGNGDVRELFVNYNASTGTFPSAGFVAPPPSAAWVLEVYSQVKVAEGTSSEVTDYCFDNGTGFLKRKRLRVSPSAPDARDIIVCYTADLAGNIAQEQYYGGDIQPLQTSPLCSLALPATDQYLIRHGYQFGVVSSSRPHTASGETIGQRTVDRDIDRNTGLVRTNRDTAGIATSYEYDAIGNTKWIKPQSGHGAWTSFTYYPALAIVGPDCSSGYKIFEHTYPNGGGPWPLTYYAKVYDGFGRLGWEQTVTPDGVYPNRFKYYNAMGWLTLKSEFSSDEPKFTQFLDYTPFGRIGTERPPEGPQHDINYEYFGAAIVRMTKSVGTAFNKSTGQVIERPSVSRKVYDRQDRLWREIQEYKDWRGNTQEHVITYKYDVAGRQLQSHKDGAPFGPSYSYDGRGVLSSIFKPGRVIGDETTTFSDIDARGHARKSSRHNHPTNTRVEVSHAYDRAERLVAVGDPNNPAKKYKEFIYADSNGPNDFRAGKLWQAKRYNDMSRFLPSVGVAVVTETYTYGGIGGAISRHDIHYSDQVGRVESFYETYTYTELGELKEIGYPNDVAGSSTISIDRERTIINTYGQRRLTGVSGLLDGRPEGWADSINYHPNGVVSRVSHSNGVADQVANDPYSRPRVSSVSTSGARHTSGTPYDFTSGDFQYDGAGALVRAGAEYFVPEEGQEMVPPGSPAGDSSSAPCYDPIGLRDPLGIFYAQPDSNCNVTTFFFLTARDRVFKVENAMTEEKKWYFSDLSGRLLSEHVMGHTHYLPWANTWLMTRDYIYRDRTMLGVYERKKSELLPRYIHIHPGHGPRGITTDQNGYRIER